VGQRNGRQLSSQGRKTRVRRPPRVGRKLIRSGVRGVFDAMIDLAGQLLFSLPLSSTWALARPSQIHTTCQSVTSPNTRHRPVRLAVGGGDDPDRHKARGLKTPGGTTEGNSRDTLAMSVFRASPNPWNREGRSSRRWWRRTCSISGVVAGFRGKLGSVSNGRKKSAQAPKAVGRRAFPNTDELESRDPGGCGVGRRRRRQRTRLGGGNRV